MTQLSLCKVKEKIRDILPGGDILFIIPPFGSIDDFQLGPLNLHAIAKAKGYQVDVLYLNILLAAVIGLETYQKIYKAPLYRMMGERLFARAAHDLPPLGQHTHHCAHEGLSLAGTTEYTTLFYGSYETFDLPHYLELEEVCFTFIQDAVTQIAALNYNIIGCTTTAIGQTNGSFALFKGLKDLAPHTITLIGGSNCDGRMAEGILSLGDSADYIFSGESEHTFETFLADYTAHRLPQRGIITGIPLENLDDVPLPDYEIKFAQYRHFLQQDPLDRVRIWYETSRGCWWAEKCKRCTFCSIHVDTYRAKSVEKVLQDLKTCHTLYPGKMIFMTDNIIPPDYPRTLFPRLEETETFPTLGYQLRPKLDLQDLLALKKARVHAILPGIEALSTHLLQLMQKGTLARQNLLILRNGRSINMFLDWNIIWGLPGDTLQDYQEILALLPLIRHLQPPNNFTPLLLMRFSPYLLQQHAHLVTQTRPWTVFEDIYPAGVQIENLATYYTGRYSSGALENPAVMQEIARQIDIWRGCWEKTRLAMNPFLGNYIIMDNRDLHEKEKALVLDQTRAKEVMITRPYQETETQQWAITQKLGVILDDWYVPLVTAPPELLLEFEENPQP